MENNIPCHLPLPIREAGCSSPHHWPSPLSHTCSWVDSFLPRVPATLCCSTCGFLTLCSLKWCQNQAVWVKSVGKWTLLKGNLHQTGNRSWWICPSLPVFWWISLWWLHVLIRGPQLDWADLPTAVTHASLTFSTPSLLLLRITAQIKYLYPSLVSRSALRRIQFPG